MFDLSTNRTNGTPISRAYNVDCMKFMERVPDKFFDLALADPPYGIRRGETFGGKNWKEYDKKDWDTTRPSKEYWQELFRISINQIVWGANYFTEYLPSSMGWIFWDKGQDLTMSDGELAFSSFEKALRRIVMNRCKIRDYGGLIHPTQKPVDLYSWLLNNYAKPGDKIFDSHMGSQSSRIAAYKLGFDYFGCELDPEYHEQGCKRFEKEIAEPLFDSVKRTHISQINFFDALDGL